MNRPSTNEMIKHPIPNKRGGCLSVSVSHVNGINVDYFVYDNINVNCNVVCNTSNDFANALMWDNGTFLLWDNNELMTA